MPNESCAECIFARPYDWDASGRPSTQHVVCGKQKKSNAGRLEVRALSDWCRDFTPLKET